MRNQRDSYFDLLRGIAIIGVIWIHTTKLADMNSILQIILRELLAFCVPLFIAISGYFTAKKEIFNKYKYYEFIIKQIPKIIIPFIIWSIIYTIASIYSGTELTESLFRFFTFRASPQFYFVLLIIQYYILSPLFFKYLNYKGLLISMMISFSVCHIISGIKEYYDLPLILYAGNFLTWIMFFFIGMDYYSNKCKFSNKELSVFLFFNIITQLLNVFYFKAIPGDINVYNFSYSFIIILLLFNNKNFITNSVLSSIGRLSYSIFLSHMLFINMLMIFIRNQLIVFITVLSLSYMLALLSSNTHPSKMYIG